MISIHASRGGSDPHFGQVVLFNLNFNPRFPRGKRPPLMRIAAPIAIYFNPRFPRGKRLDLIQKNPMLTVISIHASRGGSDDHFCGPGKHC